MGPDHKVEFDGKPFNRYINLASRLYLLKQLLPFFEMEDYEQQIVEAEIRYTFTQKLRLSDK